MVICKDFLKPLFNEKKIIITGWKNANRFCNTVEKEVNSFLLVCGQSPYRQIDKVLELWQEDYPKLTILSGKNYFKNAA